MVSSIATTLASDHMSRYEVLETLNWNRQTPLYGVPLGVAVPGNYNALDQPSWYAHVRPAGHRIGTKGKTIQGQESHARFNIRVCTA